MSDGTESPIPSNVSLERLYKEYRATNPRHVCRNYKPPSMQQKAAWRHNRMMAEFAAMDLAEEQAAEAEEQAKADEQAKAFAAFKNAAMKAKKAMKAMNAKNSKKAMKARTKAMKA